MFQADGLLFIISGGVFMLKTILSVASLAVTVIGIAVDLGKKN